VDLGAEPEKIDRGCPVQINKIFRSKKIYFLSYNFYFSVNQRSVQAPADTYLRSATAVDVQQHYILTYRNIRAEPRFKLCSPCALKWASTSSCGVGRIYKYGIVAGSFKMCARSFCREGFWGKYTSHCEMLQRVWV
jgi:hypothetical protein